MNRLGKIAIILFPSVILSNFSIVLALQYPTGKFEGKDFLVTNMSATYQGRQFSEPRGLYGFEYDVFYILGSVKNIGDVKYSSGSLAYTITFAATRRPFLFIGTIFPHFK